MVAFRGRHILGSSHFGVVAFQGRCVLGLLRFGVVAFRGCRYLGRCIFESLHFEVIACQGRRVLQSFEVVEFWGQILGSLNFGCIELWVVEFPGCRVSGASSFGGIIFWGRRISRLLLFGLLHF